MTRPRLRNNRNWWYNIRFTGWHVLESLLLIVTFGMVSGNFVIDYCSRECLKDIRKVKKEFKKRMKNEE